MTPAQQMKAFLSSFPDTSRVWFFVMDQKLPSDQETLFLADLQQVLDVWHAHKQALRAAGAFLDERVLCVALDESLNGASGCSIDSLVHSLAQLAARFHFSWADSSAVHFASGEKVMSVSRPKFQELIQDGSVTRETPVFDLLVTELSGVRSGAFLKKAQNSWHARAFRFPDTNENSTDRRSSPS